MLDILASTPVLTVFLTVALGTAVGAIPFGPLRFGPAGALFIGLALGALDPRLGEGVDLVQTLGLALFVYTVGLAAGYTFFRDLRRSLPLLGVAAGAVLLAGALTALLGTLAGLDAGTQAGAFAGAMTSTPALAAAGEAITARALDTADPAVGYSLAYPVAVAVGIVIMGLTLARSFPGRKDPAPAATAGRDAATVEVNRECRLQDVPGVAGEQVRLSYLERGNRTRVIGPEDLLCSGDRVVVVGAREDIEAAITHLGERVAEHLADDRSVVDFRRFVVSDPKVAGRPLAALDIPGRFDGTITRVRRGALDLLG